MDDLQGASRIVGGTLRGNAMGNFPQMADFPEMVDFGYDCLEQEKGKVFLYVGEDSTPLSMDHYVGSNLSSVLYGLANVYSPIKKMNSRVCVRENGVWAMKGRFSNAIRLFEALPWSQDESGISSITLKADLQAKEGIPLPSSGVGNTITPSADPETESSSLTQHIIALLNIPPSLTIRSKTTELRVAYAKYKGFLTAQNKMRHMISEGTWTLGNVKFQTLVEIFVSRSVWHASYAKLFPEVGKYPLLVKWLENQEDAPPSSDIFVVPRANYSFKDLKEALENLARKERKKKKRNRELDDDIGSMKKKMKHSYKSREQSA